MFLVLSSWVNKKRWRQQPSRYNYVYILNQNAFFFASKMLLIFSINFILTDLLQHFADKGHQYVYMVAGIYATYIFLVYFVLCIFFYML